MNISQLTTPDNRKLNGNGSRSSFELDPRAPRSFNSNHRRSATYRENTRHVRLGHVHIKVRDLNRSVRFYIRLLGLRLTESTKRYAFLSTGSEHHSIALEEIGNWAIDPSRRAVGVAHIAFQLPDDPAFHNARKRLRDAEVPFISRNNGTSWASTFKDPDGNEIEIYVDRRYSPGGATLWKSRWFGPLKSEHAPARKSFFVERDRARPADTSYHTSAGRSKPTARRSRAAHAPDIDRRIRASTGVAGSR